MNPRNLQLAFVAFICFNLYTQNIQLHYDLGKDRDYLTSTIEAFQPDKYGNTFFFIDMDYNAGDIEGVSLAYFELARVFKLSKMPVGLHVEYNGGLGQFVSDNAISGFSINDAWLTGIDYSLNAEDFSKGLTVKILYKNIRNKHDISYQLTSVWYLHCSSQKFSFTGFMDFWREDGDFDFDGKAETEFVFLSEPQLWYNINKRFAVGSEIELSNNFGNSKGFEINPTIGIKWNLIN